MRLKQWLIKQFGSKEFVESRMTSILSPQEHDLPVVETTPPIPEPKTPDISPPARDLAEAIENGAVTIYKVKVESWRRYYEILGISSEFFHDVWDESFNTVDYAFTKDEAKLLSKALDVYTTKEALAKKAKTRNDIAEYLSKQAIDKQET